MPRCLAFSSASVLVGVCLVDVVVVLMDPPWFGWCRAPRVTRSRDGNQSQICTGGGTEYVLVAGTDPSCTGGPATDRRSGEGAMSSYGQFCPVAKAMEVLDERWTLLVVRELVLGSRRFNELRRGNPRMSPALLSKRLRSLELAGVVRRETIGGHAAYTLTQAGQELEPVVRA